MKRLTEQFYGLTWLKASVKNNMELERQKKKGKKNSINGCADEVLCRPNTIARLGQGPRAPGLQVALTLG